MTREDKIYAAKALRANLKQGKVVIMKQPKLNQLSTPFVPTPQVVSNTKGSMNTAQREDGSTVTRNPSMFRHGELPPEPPDDVQTTDDTSSDTVTSDT